MCNLLAHQRWVFQSVTVLGQTIQMLGIWPRAKATGIIAVLDTPDIIATYISSTVTFTLETNYTVTYEHPLHRRKTIIGGDDSCE